MKKSSFVIMAGVIGIIIMMVIPISTTLLDILIIVNLFVSMTILLVAMNTSKPLDFSIFPAMLLVTTLYRLALNISSTRLILTQHNAGAVIQTFGMFVVGGNVVIGLIVFAILAIVQFVVITRGAERVAEVAARFTLDAMPGKQIAIDADLNSGIITEAEARDRRKEIEGEADFYGAMDGASKFVKGDALATILIVVVNIVGGFIIGIVFNHLNWLTAMKTYTVLSVGDALVSQIPALLLSTATGLIVARTASDGDFGSDVIRQVFMYPKTLFTVATAIGLMGLVTPIGIIRTWPIAIGFTMLGLVTQNQVKARSKHEKEEEVKKQVEQNKKPENMLSLLRVDPIEFEFGYSLIPIVDAKQGGDFVDRISSIRRQLALELGFLIPIVKMQDNPKFRPDEYVIKINGVQVATGTVMTGHSLAMSNGLVDEDIVGIPTNEPTFGAPAIWVSGDMKTQAEASGYTVIDPSTVLATHLKHVLKENAQELLGRKETKDILDNLKSASASLVDELVPGLLTIGQVQQVLKNLLQEKISIRPLSLILESLTNHAEGTKDPDVLTELVRQRLAKQICNEFRLPNDPLTVITLSPTAEDKFEQTLIERGGVLYVGLNMTDGNEIFNKLSKEASNLRNQGKTPVLLVPPKLRLPIRKWLAKTLPTLVILSYNELDPSVDVASGGVVNY